MPPRQAPTTKVFKSFVQANLKHQRLVKKVKVPGDLKRTPSGPFLSVYLGHKASMPPWCLANGALATPSCRKAEIDLQLGRFFDSCDLLLRIDGNPEGVRPLLEEYSKLCLALLLLIVVLSSLGTPFCEMTPNGAKFSPMLGTRRFIRRHSLQRADTEQSQQQPG